MNKWNLEHERSLLLNALMFYTRIRVPKDTPYSPELLNQSRKYFTTIGLIVGGICAITYLLAATILPLNVAVLLSIIVSILTTGAFHEDGFADTCDALGGGWQAEQVLTIMKDSRIGTYGTVGLVLMVGLKFLLLCHIAALGDWAFCLCVIAAHTISRQHSSRLIKHFNYVQDIDKSKVKPIAAAPLSKRAEEFSWFITLLSAIALAFYAPWAALVGMIVSYWLSTRFMRYCERRVGGYTGDILGAIQQLGEVSFLLACVALI